MNARRCASTITPSASATISSRASSANAGGLHQGVYDDALNYALAELATLPAAGVVVEERYRALLNNERVRPGWLLELVARLQVRYPAVPIAFADSRQHAEEWTYRYLAAALVHHAPPDVTPINEPLPDDGARTP